MPMNKNPAKKVLPTFALTRTFFCPALQVLA